MPFWKLKGKSATASKSSRFIGQPGLYPILCVFIFLFFGAGLIDCLALEYSDKLTKTDLQEPIRNYTLADIGTTEYIHQVARDTRGFIYAVAHKGLFFNDGIRWSPIAGLEQVKIQALHVDNLGNVWIGTDDDLGYLKTGIDGLAKIHSIKQHFRKVFPAFKCIKQITSAGDSVLFATESEIFRWNRRTGESAGWIPNGPVVHFFAVRNRLVASNPETGLIQMQNDGSGKLLPGSESLVGENTVVFSSSETSPESRILITLSGQLLRLENNTLIPWPTPPIDNDGGISITALCRLNSEHLAIATSENGLFILSISSGKFQPVTQEQGLPDNTVKAMITDNQDGLWAVHRYGISRICIQDFTEESAVNSATRDRESKLFLAEGTNTPVRPIYILSVTDEKNRCGLLGRYSHLAANSPVYPSTKADGRIHIKFAIPEYQNPETVEYRFRLLGHSETWSSWSPRGEKTINSLPSGEYTIQVQGKTGGKQSPSTASFTFLVVPHWYSSTLAFILYGMLLIALVILFLRLRFLHLRRLNNELQDIIEENSRKIASQAEEIKEKNSALAMTSAQLEMAVTRTEEGSRARSVFLADMSHELRTPMTGVIGMSSLLDSTDLTQEQQKFVGIIRNSGEKLLSVINGVLDISRLESGQMKLAEKPFNLCRLIEEMLEVLAPRLSEKDVELFYELEDNVPLTLTGDPERLGLVIKNLVVNAIKYTRQGHIQIRVRADMQLSETSDEIPLRFSVTDSGVGITEERKKSLFDPFNSHSEDITESHSKLRGSGFGLPVSRKIVNIMGGTINVLSKRGVGSTFYFTVKLKKRAPEQTASSSSLEKHLHNQRALVLVYNYDLRKAVLRQCHRWHLQCQDASGVEESMLLLRNDRHLKFLILDDRFLPPGRQDLLEEIVELRNRRHFGIILLTPPSCQKKLPLPCHQIEDTIKIRKPVRWMELLTSMINLDSKKRRKAPEPDKIETIEQIDLAGFATKHPLKILVAEDNEINQQVITELLAHLGYITGIAENGGEALDRCSREKYDIVLMDIHMPVMDGRKATLKIRKQVPPDQQPVIIAVTASATVEDRKKCLDAGVDLFLAKPIKMQDLMNILIDAWILASGKNNAPDQV